MNKISVCLLVLCFFVLNCGQKPDDNVQIVMIDGIKHVQNPAEPIKGTVLLELEKQLEINPYEIEDIGIRGLKFAKIMNGDVILHDRKEAHRFTKEGKYLGSIFKWGPGPGEITPRNLRQVRYINNQIWAKASRKLLKFDEKGEFIEEIKMKEYPNILIDTKQYLTRFRTWKDTASYDQIVLKKITETNETFHSPVFIEGSNLGLIKTGENTGYGDQWGTPDIEYNADRSTKKVYVGMKVEYKIQVKDVEGNTLYIIEKPHRRVKVGRKDKENILEWSEPKNLNRDVNAYPDELLSYLGTEILPQGYLAVYRISGPKEFIIDIFDNEGRYIYAIDPSLNVLFDRAIFYDFGFSTLEYHEDFPIYVEYKVKNLPEIFSDK